jgi:uncharacterized membrane protein YdbT with pleckstrin-like domain
VNELDKNLLTGEQIIFETTKHWIAPVRDSVVPALIIVGAFIVRQISPDGENVIGTLGNIFDLIANIAIIVAIAWIVLNVVEFISAHFGVTNMRVLRYEGILRRRSSETLLSTLTDVRLTEPAIGRALGYGDLRILTSSGAAGQDEFKTVKAAPALRTAIQEQKMGTGTRPAAAPTAAPVAPPPAQPTAPPAAPAPLTAAAADDATATLARLAEMRDQGLITADDYESKKADILGRM